MDNIFFDDLGDFGKYSNSYHAIFNKQTNTSVAYNLIYDAIMDHPAYVVFSSGDSENKTKILTAMIKYYESIEEYEKCANILRIKKTIQL